MFILVRILPEWLRDVCYAQPKYESSVQTKTYVFVQDSSAPPFPKPDVAINLDSLTSHA